MEKEFLKSVAQLMMEGVPVNPAELKELILRHLMASPEDYMSTRVTTSLMDAYMECARVKHLDVELLVPSEARQVLTSAFVAGFNHLRKDGHSLPDDPTILFTWPRILPIGYVYPKDILVQFGNAMGYIAASGYVERSRHHPASA